MEEKSIPLPKKGEERPLGTDEQLISVVKDTLSYHRQIIIFVNTKRGAESQAEKIANALQTSKKGEELAAQALKVIAVPTKQCKRLAAQLSKGVAFHHAGLASKQREIIEEGFRNRDVQVICATPTLAAGVDLPAFRVIIRDTKRYGGPWGMSSIPVLEYQQMAGRAGRPGKDPWGVALVLAKDEREAEKFIAEYINGEPEELYSKLAVEPVLRTYILSLTAGGFVHDRKELRSFFSKTMYAHQFGDKEKLYAKLDKMILALKQWQFLTGDSKQETENRKKEIVNSRKETRNNSEEEEETKNDDFVSANEMFKEKKSDEKLEATRLGVRVAELYLDPYTARHLIKGLERYKSKQASYFTLIHLCASCLELRPFLKVRSSEIDMIEEKIEIEKESFLALPPSQYTAYRKQETGDNDSGQDYDTFMDTVKTAMLLESWTEEADEETLLEHYGTRPGELHAKLELIDWIVYATIEIARILGMKKEQNAFTKLRTRLKHGAKEELLPLLKLKGVGRVRARKMFGNGIKHVADIQRIDATSLAQLVGKATAIQLKEQVGQKIAEENVVVKPHKRKGQISLNDF